ncbi:alkene reductase [Tsukamurella tyrosinosolvens]|uniref:alkene reductase n=1 Tax=Tsukamurella tyrosinosolvens TaxID=57704 RepID=UPI00079C9487|nr:alkene reductase [Tsukamurella tyrosinosolvens]KXP07959.1 1,2-oxophytodienoate reductase [Tsukamurella tyrosinosolvens]KZL97482.1 1,2-oxophytodienoate reductase [Tsukamurella tyrosinosolvens]MCA4995932.1 alkene reductase [Tsukamurella tyrosinosolvens]WEL91760.1 alkene reductase [Tsukamurella tyrosinosolvens]
MSLFTPYRSHTLDLPHRIVMAPMTRLRSEPDGSPTADVADYYRQRAGAALIVTEGMWPHSSGQSEAWVPGLATDRHQRAWARVVDAVHAEGGRIVAQLMHGGRKGHPAARIDGSVPAGPSAVPDGDVLHLIDGSKAAWPRPAAMSIAEIEDAVGQYAASARRALAAGFDGVELHGANSYLIHQFLADNTNLRDDRYGGSAENRMRFALEVVDAVSDVVGAARTAIRLSPGNPQFSMVERDPADLYRGLVDELGRRGLMYLHLTDNDDYAALADLRPRFDGTVVANVGENRVPTSAPAAERALADGADLVSFGRAFIANPDLVERIRRGLPLAPIREDVLYGRTAEGYSDYPCAAVSAGGDR